MSGVSLEELTDILKSHDKVVLYFGAEWCGPCKHLKPKVLNFLKKYPDLYFVDVDVDHSDELATKYNIQSVPQVHYFFNQEHRKGLTNVGSDAVAVSESLTVLDELSEDE